jgi:hypothetical protein
MNQTDTLRSKISARDRAQRLMNGLTAGVTMAAVAGVGALGYVSAVTIPGSTSAVAAATTTSSSTSTSSASSSTGLSSSSGTVSSSSGTGVAVSGGS